MVNQEMVIATFAELETVQALFDGFNLGEKETTSCIRRGKNGRSFNNYRGPDQKNKMKPGNFAGCKTGCIALYATTIFIK